VIAIAGNIFWQIKDNGKVSILPVKGNGCFPPFFRNYDLLSNGAQRSSPRPIKDIMSEAN
jgi:hypothetical protein